MIEPIGLMLLIGSLAASCFWLGICEATPDPSIKRTQWAWLLLTIVLAASLAAWYAWRAAAS